MNVIIYLSIAALVSGCAVSAEQKEREKRMQNSPQWNGKKFQNIEPVPGFSLGQYLSVGYDYFTKKSKNSVISRTKKAMFAILWMRSFL